MSFPIFVRNYINEPTIWFIIGFLLMVLFIVALYFDFWYREPQSKELATQLNKDIYAAISESLTQKVSTNFLGSILSKEEYEEKYSIENQAQEIRELLSNNAYKIKPGFEKPSSSWVNTVFQAVKKSDAPKKQVNAPYRVFPVQKLSIEESMKISVGSVELERVEI